MNSMRVVLVGTLLSAVGSYLAGQEATRPAVFTSGQSEAGRTAYEKSCGQCHTYTLRGRQGEAGELPPWNRFLIRISNSSVLPSACRR